MELYAKFILCLFFKNVCMFLESYDEIFVLKYMYEVLTYFKMKIRIRDILCPDIWFDLTWLDLVFDLT